MSGPIRADQSRYLIEEVRRAAASLRDSDLRCWHKYCPYWSLADIQDHLRQDLVTNPTDDAVVNILEDCATTINGLSVAELSRQDALNRFCKIWVCIAVVIQYSGVVSLKNSVAGIVARWSEHQGAFAGLPEGTKNTLEEYAKLLESWGDHEDATRIRVLWSMSIGDTAHARDLASRLSKREFKL